MPKRTKKKSYTHEQIVDACVYAMKKLNDKSLYFAYGLMLSKLELDN